MLRKFFVKEPEDRPAERLYAAAVTQARTPAFYLDMAVPDTLDGRFELICLHCYLLLRRLRLDQEATAEVAQDLVDLLFEDMDSSLREMGAGDLGVGKRVKRMAEAFSGRLAAYDKAWSEGSAELAEALKRNLYGTTEVDLATLERMSHYLECAALDLERQPTEALLRGQAGFVAVKGEGRHDPTA